MHHINTLLPTHSPVIDHQHQPRCYTSSAIPLKASGWLEKPQTCLISSTQIVLLNILHMNCEAAIVPGEFSYFVTTCAVLTVNVQMVVGGCRLTLFARTVCTPAMMSDLAEQHFNWSHFCQTRQAKTHLGIQGVPADKTPTSKHTLFWWYSRKYPHFSAALFLMAKTDRLLSQLGSKA